MKKILITAFEPFNNLSLNSSFEVISRIEEIEGVELFKEILPVVYQPELYLDLIDKYQPDIILLCGQAEGRSTVDLEQVAINYQYASLPDNLGVFKTGELIFEDGDVAYFSSIPALEIVRNLQKENLPIKLSLSAGGYICNMAYYATIYYAKQRQKKMGVCFVHFPLYPNQVKNQNIPSLKLDLMVEIMYKIIKELR